MLILIIEKELSLIILRLFYVFSSLIKNILLQDPRIKLLIFMALMDVKLQHSKVMQLLFAVFQ